jgi:hypothetical protein
LKSIKERDDKWKPNEQAQERGSNNYGEGRKHVHTLSRKEIVSVPSQILKVALSSQRIDD